MTGDRQALEVVCRAADCLYDYFILGKRTFASQNWGECNFAASHMFALLYEQTRDPRYLQAAEYIVRTEWTLPYHDFYTNSTLSCNWLESSGRDPLSVIRRRSAAESLYTLTTLAVLSPSNRQPGLCRRDGVVVVGDREPRPPQYRQFRNRRGRYRRYLRRGQRNRNTVAWMTFSTEYLKLSKNSYVADELELSYFNATLGSQLSDKEFVYMNSSDGQRVSSQIELAPHSYERRREMNCCQASGQPGPEPVYPVGRAERRPGYLFELLRTVERPDAYAERASDRNRAANRLPESGSVRITLDPGRAERFGLNLRIPVWSSRASVRMNGVPCSGVTPGHYYRLERSGGRATSWNSIWICASTTGSGTETWPVVRRFITSGIAFRSKAFRRSGEIPVHSGIVRRTGFRKTAGHWFYAR